MAGLVSHCTLLMGTWDLLVTLARLTASVGLLFLVPGVGLGPWLVPGSMSPLARLTVAVAVSLVTASLACTALAIAGWLHPATLVPLLLALGAVPVAISWRRGQLVRSRPSPRRRRWSLTIAGLLTLAIAVVIIPSQAQVGPSLLPFTSTVWYYGELSQRLAASGAIPAGIPEWGGVARFHTDYLPFSAHAAGLFLLLPDDLPLRLETYRLAILAAAVLVAALLFRRAVPTWLAVLGAILLLGTVRMDAKFLAFKPETFGIVVALFALYALDRALVERSRRLTATAALAATVTFLSHAEVYLVLVAAAAGLVVARLLVAGARDRHPRLGLRRPDGATLRGILGRGALVLIASSVGGAIANGAFAGEFRLVGYLLPGASGGRPAAADHAEAPPGWASSGDPTWDFYVAAAAPAELGLGRPTSFLDARLLARNNARVWPGLDGRHLSMFLVLTGLCAFPVLAWPVLDPRRRRLVLGMLATGCAIAAGSVLLFAIADTYVPQRVGPRRLVPYELFVPVSAAIVALFVLHRALRPAWAALLASGSRSGVGAPRSRRAGIAGIVAIALLAVGMIAPDPSDRDEEAARGLSPTGSEVWAWVARSTPADARILTNAYTDGVVGALGGRTGILDGRAVYLEDPGFLASSTSLLLRARSAFRDPDGPVADRLLRDEAVTHIVLVDERAGGSASDLGGYTPFDTDVAALAQSGRYTLLATFGSGRVRVFGVRHRD